MNKIIENYLKYGVYKNTLYFPNTFKNTQQYLKFLNPMINEMKKENRKELIEFAKNNDLGIYQLSILVSVLGLSKGNYSIISNKINDNKTMLIFLWIYVIINGKNKNMYLNKLLVEKTIFVENNVPEIFNIYKPSYAARNEIKSILRNKYRVRYMIETQERLRDILNFIRKNDIKPIDVAVEMGFTFDNKVKNSIVSYFIEDIENNIVDLFYYIDRWYIDEIPTVVLEHIQDRLNEKLDMLNIYNLLILNTSIRHKKLSKLIEDYIGNLENEKININININYIPNMNMESKWDGLHKYNSYISSIICIMNEYLTTNINIRDQKIDNTNSLQLYNEVLNNVNFSLEKCEPIQSLDNTITILFSSEIVEGYDILWNVTDDSCPLYIDNGYLEISGKNAYLLLEVMKYIHSLGNKVINSTTVNNSYKNMDIDFEDDNISIKNRIIDSLENTLEITKDALDTVKFNINKK